MSQLFTSGCQSVGASASILQRVFKVDFLALNGIESISGGEDAVGFSVGKVRVDGKARSCAGGAMSASISPAAISYLEQTGLMNPAVPVVGGCVC